jgi:hypothetical protein
MAWLVKPCELAELDMDDSEEREDDVVRLRFEEVVVGSEKK